MSVSVDKDHLFFGYHTAWRLVFDQYPNEVLWAERLDRVKPDLPYVMREAAWVIINSGFRYRIARQLWPDLEAVFHGFDPAKIDDSCLAPALRVLNHDAKMLAIVAIARILREEGIDPILADAQEPPRLTRLPFIGKVTCYHFAKLLGVDVVKPDLHLERAAKAAGFDTPLALCTQIRETTGDRLTVIDSVLWRYGEQQQARGWLDWADLWGKRALEWRAP